MRVSRRKASASPVTAARKHQHTHLKTIRISNACSSIRIAPPDTVLVSHAAVDFAKLSERQPNLIIAPTPLAPLAKRNARFLRTSPGQPL